MHPVSQALHQTISPTPSMSMQSDQCTIHNACVELQKRESRRLMIEHVSQSLNSPRNCSCTYSDPFLILFPITDPITDPSSCTVLSACIIYNMGLTNHLAGSAQCLRNALHLYELALRLICSGAQENPSEDFVMACLNNCGVLNHSIGNFPESRRWFHELRAYLLRQPGPPNARSALERERFLLNTTLLTEPKMAGAA